MLYLAHNVCVCESDNHTIFGSVVLILVLGHKTLAGTVVGLTLYRGKVDHVTRGTNDEILSFTSSSFELDLISLEVSLVLDHLNEWLEVKTN